MQPYKPRSLTYCLSDGPFVSLQGGLLGSYNKCDGGFSIPDARLVPLKPQGGNIFTVPTSYMWGFLLDSTMGLLDHRSAA